MTLDPLWLMAARKELGQRELPSNRGPAVERYIKLAKGGSIGDPWCAIFANAMLESAGVKGTRSASSQSFRHSSLFVQLPGPALGALAVFWRGSKVGPYGHVGFYTRERDGYVWIIAGNDGDMVREEAHPRVRNDWGLRGFWWPKSVALPETGPIIAANNVPMMPGILKKVV